MAAEFAELFGDVSPELVDDVRRAFFDPMIGGWPLIHWEWVFCLDPGSSGVAVTGEWPESEGRRVELRSGAGSRVLDEGVGLG